MLTMVVNRVGWSWPTRLPLVTCVRLMRPLMGARMSVYPSWMVAVWWAAAEESRAAWATASWAWFTSTVARALSTSDWVTAPPGDRTSRCNSASASRIWAFQLSMSARALAWSATARATADLYSRGSMV